MTTQPITGFRRARWVIASGIGHAYPFVSGCGSFANCRAMRALTGTSAGEAWAAVRGGSVLVPMNDYVGRALVLTGDLDRKVSWVCRRLIRLGDIAVDIGANLGLITVLSAHLVGPEGRVHSFEPNPRVNQLLSRTVQRLPHGVVTHHKCGLGAQPGVMRLSVPPNHLGMGSVVSSRRGNDSFEVAIDTLDNRLRDEDTARIRFIKIDVEGFESQVLAGAAGVLSALRRAAVLFEARDQDRTADQPSPIATLRGLGFRLFGLPKTMLVNRTTELTSDQGVPGVHDYVAVTADWPAPEIRRLLRSSR